MPHLRTASIVLALCTESLQLLTLARSGSLFDLGIDLFGGLVGVGIAMFLGLVLRFTDQRGQSAST